MTWTYDPSMATAKDRVRFRLGDTIEADPLLQDEEIAYLIADGGSVGSVTIACADALAARFARMAQSVTDDIGQSVNYGDRAKQFATLATRLRTSGARAGVPFAGGISQGNKAAISGDTDRVAPHFTRLLHDDRGITPVDPRES